MKLLYATNNNSKVYNMRRRLENIPIEIITPKELGIKVNVIEDGKTAVENAIKKARGYYEETKIPTIAGDSGLFIDGIPSDKQPGLFVRRVNDKVLSDDEMIEYYTKLIESIGGKSTGYYVTGLALITEQGLFTTEISEDKFILSSTISNNNHRGNPLDVMTIDPVSKKFYTDMTDEDFKSLGHVFDKECVKFLQENLLNESKKLQKMQ
jgi:inosine/xanthosine triphosphate pyrophosphatase family protein